MTDYLDWQSDISLEQVFARGDNFSYPHLFGDSAASLLYLTFLKEQKSRSALMLQRGDDVHCITPESFSLRTKVNEYGGKPYWVFGDEIVFANHLDQCLYRQELSADKVGEASRITALSDGHELCMYTDVNRIDRESYIAIVEKEDVQGHARENSMCIALLAGDEGDFTALEIRGDADFYSNLVVSPNANYVAWVQWNHPNMPWDECELWIAELSLENGVTEFSNALHVDLAQGASICQLIFSNNDRLFFSVDYPSGSAGGNCNACEAYWNVHCYDLAADEITRVTDLSLEFGYPHWVYGDHRIVRLSDSQLLAVGSAPEKDQLFLIDTDSLSVCMVNSTGKNSGSIQHLSSDGEGAFVAVQLYTDQNPVLIEGTLLADQISPQLQYRKRLSDNTETATVSVAQHLRFNTRDGASAYGFFYPPINSSNQHCDEPSGKPPLIVMVHGGPTARAYGDFDIQKQFWTSRGFALLDVNHRGSSGYGRDYRDALYQGWGELDASDIIDGIEMLISEGRVDRNRVCIRGKSAGGYAVLRALTEYPDHFKAGACYYGIGNLVTLAEVTHKFEKYYTDRLIGETYSSESANIESSRFWQRSPIHKMANVKSAMIIFQGLMDKVVPPSVAREVINVLGKADVDHVYVEYADEGHGFRQVSNNIDAWGKELEFYQRVLDSSG